MLCCLWGCEDIDRRGCHSPIFFLSFLCHFLNIDSLYLPSTCLPRAIDMSSIPEATYTDVAFLEWTVTKEGYRTTRPEQSRTTLT